MEHIQTPKVENVGMIDRYNCKNSSIGTLYLTATHLIFVDPEVNKETWILHMRIGSIEKLPLTTTGSPILVRCKNFHSVIFVIPKERECHNVYQTLIKLSQPASYENLYCFQYQSRNESFSKSCGWNIFTLEKEFHRMKVPHDQWIMTSLNNNYEMCDTYPKQLFVPAKASTAMLLGSSRFRSKGRLPVLTYLHHNNASICRCSQPLSGFSARCLEDEQLLESIRKTNPNTNYMYVVDTRPRINAMANRAAGKGYENEAFYENTKFYFLGIENIHIMRASLQKLIEVCEQKSPTVNGFINSIESSGWLRHIRTILDTSSFIANAVNKGTTVVVHCSDGWDRTAQVCSLAALLLDPYYRTINGYQSLIEKDWLAFGHKFNDRNGHILMDSKEISPIFTQFLECTWQLMQQRSINFEFNEKFLLTLHDHVQSCQFGTFIGNCERERIKLNLTESTYSLWGFMLNHLNEYRNPLYKPEMDEIFLPDLKPQNFKFWRGMYNRFEEVHPREPIEDILGAVYDHCTSLEDHTQYLKNQIFLLKENISTLSSKTTLYGKGKEERSHLQRKNLSKGDENKHFEKDEEKRTLCSLNDDQPPKHTSNESVHETSTVVEAYCPYQYEIKNKKSTTAIETVAIEWKPFRSIMICSCSTPFDNFNEKTHCWKCGEVYCVRCIDKNLSLPGHHSGSKVPVCRSCFKLLFDTTP